MKTCKRCGVDKAKDAFYAHPQTADGRLNICKECVLKQSKLHRNANGEAIRERDRARFQKPEVKARRREYAAKYNATDRGKMVRAKGSANDREKNAAAVHARSVLYEAIRSGKLTKLPCLVCGSSNVEAHHGSYDLPLDVSWLCSTHHAQLHREHRERMRKEQA
jgi:hypothetical protein